MNIQNLYNYRCDCHNEAERLILSDASHAINNVLATLEVTKETEQLWNVLQHAKHELNKLGE